jgi:hypothetical protein
MGPTGCPETSVNNYHSALRNIPEEGRLESFSCVFYSYKTTSRMSVHYMPQTFRGNVLPPSSHQNLALSSVKGTKSEMVFYSLRPRIIGWPDLTTDTSSFASMPPRQKHPQCTALDTITYGDRHVNVQQSPSALGRHTTRFYNLDNRRWWVVKFSMASTAGKTTPVPRSDLDVLQKTTSYPCSDSNSTRNRIKYSW